MLFFVKTEVPRDKVDEFTEKLIDRKMRSVEGNISYVSPDGCFGYDIVECTDESQCRQKYDDLVRNGLRIHEIVPILSMGHYLEAWKRQHQKAA